MQPVLAVLAGFAVIAALLGWSRWLTGRRWTAAAHLLLAGLLGLTVAVGWPLERYLQSFELRTAGRPAAEVFFERIGPGRFRAAVTHLPSGRMQVVDLAGDEWRLGLQVLDWTDRAARLGAQPRYRTETVSSRPAPAADAGLPLGATARLIRGEETAPWLATSGAGGGVSLVMVRALHGPWLPMADGARFDVRVTADDDVEVDPINAPAEDALTAR